MSKNLIAYETLSKNSDATLQFIDKMGEAFHKGGIAGVKSIGEGKVIALTCLCEAITPLEFMRRYHLIEGKPSMRADAMLADYRGFGGKCEWLSLGDDGQEAKARFTLRENSLVIGYTIDHAKAAGLVKPKSSWEKDPGSMLRARCISKAMRIVAPEVVTGIYAPEDFDEFGEDSNGQPKPKRSRQSKKKPVEKVEDAEFEVKKKDDKESKELKKLVAEDEAGQAAAKAESDELLEDSPAELEWINRIGSIVSEYDLKEEAKFCIEDHGVDSARALSRREARIVYMWLVASVVQIPVEKVIQAAQKFGRENPNQLTCAQLEQLILHLEMRLPKK